MVLVAASMSNAVAEWWWLVLAVGCTALLADLLLPIRPRTPDDAVVHVGPDTRRGASSQASAGPGPAPGEPVPSAGLLDAPGATEPASYSEFDTVPAADVRTVVLPPSPSKDTQGAPVPAVGGTMSAAVETNPANAPADIRPGPSLDQSVWTSDALWVPKSSHDDVEHEDAWAIDDSAGRAALSDGASSAFMAREWARTVTSRYLDDPPEVNHGSFVRWVGRATQQWRDGAEHAGGAQAGADGAWWAGESEKRGSFATLVGVSAEPGEPTPGGRGIPLAYSAVAVGDSCMVHLSQAGERWKRIAAFPIDDPASFGKHPELVASTGARTDGSFPVLRAVAGQLIAGDALLLMSDALAEFALGAESGGAEQSVWDWLMSVGQEEFARGVVRARGASRIEDDDTTLVRLRF